MQLLSAGPKKHKVDSHCTWANSAEVVEDWDCMLNQTNIGFNNNKFYVIQLLLERSRRPG